MVKAKDIIKIKKEHEKYKKLLEHKTDIIKKLKWICVNILDTKIRTYLSCIQSLKFYLIRSIIIKS